MIKIRKIKLNKIKNFFGKAPRALAQNAFLTFLVLLLIALFSGGIIFYFYAVSIEIPDEAEFEEEMAFQLDESAYQKALSQWQMRDERFFEIDLREYSNIFR